MGEATVQIWTHTHAHTHPKTHWDHKSRGRLKIIIVPRKVSLGQVARLVTARRCSELPQGGGLGCL